MISNRDSLREFSLSCFGRCEACATDRSGLCGTHEKEMSEMGIRLASLVDPNLWKINVRPGGGDSITRLEGFNIQVAALEKAQTTLKHLVIEDLLSDTEKERIKALSPVQISANPELFNEWLRIAKKADDFAKMLKFNSCGKTYGTPVSELFGKLKEIVLLSFAGSVEALPDCIGKFSVLTTLMISRTGLKCLPDTIGDLSALSKLWFDQNQLRCLPEAIGNLSALTVLVLFENRLRALPGSFGNLKGLVHLDLSHNRLRKFPDSFWNLFSLQHLSLCDNRIGALPESIENFTQLDYLDLSDNMLEALPESLERLPALKHLDLRDNDLIITPQLCSLLTRLRQRGCKIHCEPEVEKAISSAEEGLEAPQAKKKNS